MEGVKGKITFKAFDAKKGLKDRSTGEPGGQYTFAIQGHDGYFTVSKIVLEPATLEIVESLNKDDEVSFSLSDKVYTSPQGKKYYNITGVEKLVDIHADSPKSTPRGSTSTDDKNRSFALAYAKDIVVANQEVQACSINSLATVAKTAVIIADLFNEWLNGTVYLGR